MKASQLPVRVPVPFASSANPTYVRAMQIASQIGITNGQWSYTDGSPPLNFLPEGSGGVPPDGRDFNALMLAITQWTQWQSAGGTSFYDATFAAAVGGYPMGAVVSSTTAGTLWLCTADNNTTNPDSATAANWIAFLTTSTNVGKGLVSQSVAGTYQFVVPAGIYWIYATVVGAGGGGSGGASSGGSTSGAGGGAGGAAQGWIAVTPKQNITYVVGLKGSGGNYQVTGSNGGTSSIGSTMQATGGFGATGNPPAGGAGGLGSGGQSAIYGGNGSDGSSTSGTTTGGAGGSSLLGGGGRSSSYFNPGVSNGQAPGSGGGGTYSLGGGGQGGNGADGYVSFQY